MRADGWQLGEQRNVGSTFVVTWYRDVPAQAPPMRRETVMQTYQHIGAFNAAAPKMHAAGYQIAAHQQLGKKVNVTWVRDVPATMAPPHAKKKGLPAIAIVGIVIGALFLIGIIGSAASGGKKEATATPARVSSGNAPSPQVNSDVAAVAATDTPAKPAATAKPTETPKPAPTAKPTDTARPPTNTPTPKPSSDVRVPLAQSNQGTADGHRITIVSITDDAKSDNQFEQPHAGNKFIAVTVILENASPKEIFPGAWRLRTNTDFEYAGMSESGVGQPLPFDSITSGGKVQGVVVFEVPKTEKVKWIKYDPNTFTDADLYFDA